MSLNEIAADLTCESTEFEPATSARAGDGDEDEPLPGQFTFPATGGHALPTASSTAPQYHVHSGILQMAHTMGDVDRPVQLAVSEALRRCPGYGEPATSFVLVKLECALELVLCGHSLGAGVAALLGLVRVVSGYLIVH
jgi:hypothetical protein